MSNYQALRYRARRVAVALALGAHALLGAAVAQAQQSPPKAPAAPAFFAKQGIKVVAQQAGPGGLNVWQVEREGVKTVLYTTPDAKVLFSGVLWDAATGKNLSDAFITPEMMAAAASAAVQAPAASPEPTATPAAATALAKPAGGPSEALKSISKLTGIKEGNAPFDKTLYIIFDPRCPHCHAAYQKTRKYVAAGGAIKWLPSTVLGRPDDGMRLIADIMQAKDQRAALAKTMGKVSGGETTPNAQTRQTVAENEMYFWASFDANKGAGTAGVPVAYFETKEGPQMVAGIDDDELLKRILTDIKK
ncbi:DsbC family protein [Cupriavidus sp. TMH.W2]|uniref:DsbC family protein n=1 Tax=Cupriavidus sp. TMH.W2 TaxID=3434465 RepID=UPI003D76D6DC